MARPERPKRVGGLLIAAGVFIVALGLYIFAVRPAQAAARMDRLADAAVLAVKPGMSVPEAMGALDHLGLTHSGKVLEASMILPGPEATGGTGTERGVVLAMIRCDATGWSIVRRDVQIRVWVDEHGEVSRVERRDVLTGP